MKQVENVIGHSERSTAQGHQYC